MVKQKQTATYAQGTRCRLSVPPDGATDGNLSHQQHFYASTTLAICTLAAPRPRPVIHHWLRIRPPEDRPQFLDIAVIVTINRGRNDTVDGFNISPRGLRRESKPNTANNRDKG